MKRTVALTLILVVLLLGAFSSSAGARDAVQQSPNDQFYSMLGRAARPASGLEMYENIHKYMWRTVYVMGKVDHALPATEHGQFIFIRTWLGEGHRIDLEPSGVDFAFDILSEVHIDNELIVGDAIIHLPPGMKMPYRDFELVGGVCGIKKYHVRYPGVGDYGPGAGYPVICIADDGLLRIRRLPVVIKKIEPYQP